MLLLAGRTLGLAVLLTLILGGPILFHAASDLVNTSVHAQQDVPAAPPDPYKAITGGDIINPINTGWVLLGAFLVFGMQAGFTMLEAGFCRNRETVNVLVECMFDTCVCGILHWAWGFAFMFGGGNAFIGWHLPGDPTKSLLFMKDVDVMTTYGSTGIPILAHYLFQFAFADCASTICSGAMVGRTLFMGDVLYSIGVSGFIYPVFGHWCWGPDGFLATMGSAGGFLSSLGMNFHDFAGSTVVHSIGGWVAIAGAIMLGPRLGRRFKRDGGGPMPPHDLTIAVIGGLILWFGWYGFNPGSTLSLMDNAGVGRVGTNTTLAACTGGIAAILVMYFRTKKWDTTAIINGFLAGLVGITAPCYWVSSEGAKGDWLSQPVLVASPELPVGLGSSWFISFSARADRLGNSALSSAITWAWIEITSCASIELIGSESMIENHVNSSACWPLNSAFRCEPVRISPGQTVVMMMFWRASSERIPSERPTSANLLVV